MAKNIDLFSIESFRLASEAFFTETEKSRLSPEDFLKQNYDISLSQYSSDKAYFAYGINVTNAYRVLERVISEKLPAKHFNRRDLENLVWEVAEETNSPKANSKLLSDRIKQSNEVTYRVYLPNWSIQLPDGALLDWGVVKITPTKFVASEVSERTPHFKVVIIGEETSEIAGSKVEFTKTCWEVHVKATKSNVREEAIWLTNIFTSLLRLCLLSLKEPRPLFPFAGDQEASSAFKMDVKATHLTFYGTIMSSGGFHALGRYIISAASLDYASKWTKKATSIFEAKPNTIGERFAQGLGWLTVGRQTSSQAEKFLHFFTAIESLLSSKDDREPVTQTIARSAATILTNEIDHRIEFSKELRDLYGRRSKLIHNGMREITDMDVRNLQYLAEALYFVVIDKCDLTDSLQAFHADLAKCAYGKPWPNNEVY